MSYLLQVLRGRWSGNISRANLARCYGSHPLSSFSKLITAETNEFHVYLSGIRDPYLNLSIEHYIYEKSAPSSTILLLYVNDPCVVIGRNQNPWLEANLHDLTRHNIPLIRRRSGGGTVFHDHGNVNFSVIYPPSDFTRDKYAELVTRALRPYQPRVRVNERHDIVVDQGDKLDGVQPKDDMHRSGYESTSSKKCSGSAYKLSRHRALHHGTCLINSRNLESISALLRSPLQPFVKARGVDSVRSPVTNVFSPGHRDSMRIFVRSIIETFNETHRLDIPVLDIPEEHPMDTLFQQVNENTVQGLLGSDLKEIEAIRKGMQELRSPIWQWGQTPRFDFSSFPAARDDKPRPHLPDAIPSTTRFQFSSRSGQILSANLSTEASAQLDIDGLVGKHIGQFDSWTKVLRLKPTATSSALSTDVSNLALWLDRLFGKTKEITGVSL